jgi:hypothetical protein
VFFVSELLVADSVLILVCCIIREAVAAPARTAYAVKKAAPGAPPPPASLGAIPKKTRVGQLYNYSHFSPVF